MSDYFVINIQGLAKEDEDLATGYWFECGAEGVAETLSFRQDQDDYEPILVEKDHIDIQVYFLQPPPVERVESFALQFSVQKIDVTNEMNKDWLEEWKKGFQAFALVKDIWVVPSWLEKPKEATTVIEIDPGMAFGTGTHATTQIASQLIGECLAEKPTPSSIDVGTGSGILALLMRHLGVDRVYAYDNDDESERVFLENLEKNKATAIDWVENWPELGSTDLQLVVANIIDGVLIELKESFMKLSRPGHRYIFTGILKEREQDFLKEMMQGWSLTLVQKIEKEEWVGFCFEVSS